MSDFLLTFDYWLKPIEPCDCDREHSVMTAAGLINDPQEPTHDPSCKWHIKYRLRWWSA